jgi:hypothetical protein
MAIYSQRYLVSFMNSDPYDSFKCIRIAQNMIYFNSFSLFNRKKGQKFNDQTLKPYYSRLIRKQVEIRGTTNCSDLNRGILTVGLVLP